MKGQRGEWEVVRGEGEAAPGELEWRDGAARAVHAASCVEQFTWCRPLRSMLRLRVWVAATSCCSATLRR